jgi:hypothetical protein
MARNSFSVFDKSFCIAAVWFSLPFVSLLQAPALYVRADIKPKDLKIYPKLPVYKCLQVLCNFKKKHQDNVIINYLTEYYQSRLT